MTKVHIKRINEHNKNKSIVQPNFLAGDLVLVRRAHDRVHKFNFRWVGPRRIAKIYSDLTYEIEKLGDRSAEKVHFARLCLYIHKEKEKPVSKELLDLADCTKIQYKIAENCGYW